MTVQIKNALNFRTEATGRSASSTTGRSIYRTFFKRALDILIVVASAPFTLPVIVALAVCAALNGAAPFYRQKRVGQGGQVFDLLKIRTMVPNADALLDAYLAANPAARREWDRTQKLKDDPRVTAFGRILRKTSLDELPQLWNVLKGDMSLIGPRPMMVDQTDLYPGSAYYKLRPGITGPWQVSDRNASSFAARAKFDTDYYRDLSFGNDLAILARTICVVFRCTGY
jgi:lipopolysaccharide/colanic/teichoic acid biosynthesis glycosyltransferase